MIFSFFLQITFDGRESMLNIRSLRTIICLISYENLSFDPWKTDHIYEYIHCILNHWGRSHLEKNRNIANLGKIPTFYWFFLDESVPKPVDLILLIESSIN